MNLVFDLLVLVQLSVSLHGMQSDGVIGTALYTIGSHLTQNKIPSNTLPVEPGFGTVLRKIQKRTAYGPRAIVQRLISEAKSVFSHNTKRINYKIEGDLNKAMKDFYSFDPVNVRIITYEGDRAHVGWAGGQYLMLRPKSLKGDTVLEVIDWEKKGQGHYIQRFIYEKSKHN